jgi:hypothetical protein
MFSTVGSTGKGALVLRFSEVGTALGVMGLVLGLEKVVFVKSRIVCIPSGKCRPLDAKYAVNNKKETADARNRNPRKLSWLNSNFRVDFDDFEAFSPSTRSHICL